MISLSRCVRRWLLAGGFPFCSLVAQDLTVGEPVWFSNDPAPEAPLKAGNLKPRVPEALIKSTEVGLGVATRFVDANGRVLSALARATHPPLEQSLGAEVRSGWDAPMAQRDGKRVATRFWVPVIFNPKSADPKAADATPRLLKAVPALTLIKPAPAEEPQVVRMKLALDETGAIVSAVPTGKTTGNLLKAVQEALAQWKFAPARRGGQPVAAEIVVPVLCHGMRLDQSNYTPPRQLEAVRPAYPAAMRRFGLSGRVVCDFDVMEDGHVAKVGIFESDNPAFDEAAVEAVRRWRYQPAMRDGKPLRMRVRQPVHFNYTGEGGAGASGAYRVTDEADQSKLPPELRFDTAPQIRGVTLPVYPHALRVEAVRGRARAAMLVGPAGEVTGVKILAADRPEFGLALAAALQGFKFDPAYRGGQPVPTLVNFEQRFDPYSLPDEPGDDLLGWEKKSPGKFTPQAQLDAPLKVAMRREARFPLFGTGGPAAGEAVVECVVDQKGRVRLPRVKSASDPVFGYAAVQAASAWWFEPPLAGGKPVTVREEIPFRFAAPAADGRKTAAP